MLDYATQDIHVHLIDGTVEKHREIIYGSDKMKEDAYEVNNVTYMKNLIKKIEKKNFKYYRSNENS